MLNVVNFIKWALTHVNSSTVPSGAQLPLSIKDCGKDPWHYLFGTVRVATTTTKLQERWKNYYSTHGWTREQYEYYTKGWKSTDYATDCQGLLDAYLTYECNTKTDINADTNYNQWCTSRGQVSSISRSYVVGEALFMANSSGKMHHVGWICGFDATGNPLVVEARGLPYGVVVTKFNDRAWTHRGLMTTKFSYDNSNNVEEDKPMAQIIFEKTSPMKTGEVYKEMQKVLNLAGYTDAKGKKLTEDGKWGTNSQAAFDSLIKAHSVSTPVVPEVDSGDAFVLTSTNGKQKMKI